MTHPHDPPRQWSRPVEEVARAIDPISWGHIWSATAAQQEAGRANSSHMAEAAITRLISLGFINENGIEAMKAEKEKSK